MPAERSVGTVKKALRVRSESSVYVLRMVYVMLSFCQRTYCYILCARFNNKKIFF